MNYLILDKDTDELLDVREFKTNAELEEYLSKHSDRYITTEDDETDYDFNDDFLDD